ncbi:MAG: PAS domain S-box protein, partial [Anaerolineales bacterium]|nr:PAS domain S-box protein [Anaerolineales bacterium]
MEDKNKTKAQLIQELKALRQQMTELEVERQGAETALQRSEARFQRFSEAAFEGIAIHEGGILVDANQALAKMFGYELAEMIGMNLLNLAAPEFHDIIREKIRAGSEESYEASGTKKDGTIIWVQLVSKPCYFQGRKARIASFKEITEYKRIEQELLESQKNLQTLFDSLDDYLFVLDVEGRILQVNPVVLSRLGYAKDELLGQSVFMVRPPDRREEVVATFVNAMAGKTDNCQIPLLTKSGQQIPVETKITMGSWGKQKVIFGVSRDMTVHEQVKEQLISEKNFSELLINSLPGIFYLFDANGKFLRWNNNFETVVGYSAEELSQMHPMEYIADEEKESAAKAIQKVFETGHADLETTFISRSGVKTPFYLTGIRIMVNGQPCLLGAGLDISEQKRAEDLLRVQRELGMGLLAAPKLDEALTICLETTLSASGMEAGGIYLVDETSGINLIYHCGLHPDFVQQVQHYDYDLNSPTVQLILAGQPIYFDSEQMTGPISRAPAGKDIRSLAIIPVQFEGQVIACLNVGSYTYSSVPDHARTTLEAIATQIGTAISRSQVEKALRESEARLALAIEASQAGYYILAADFSYMYVNERGAGNLGYRLDELPPSGPEKIAMWTGRIHPDDSPTVTQGFSEFLENKVETYQAEYRMQHKDGTWLWMSSMGTAIERDEQGKVIRMAGIIFDITAQKEAEAALRQSEEKLRSTLDSLSDLVFVFNQDGIFEEYYQPIDRPELYVPPEMFLGRHFKEVMPPHVSQLFEQAIAEIIEFHDIRQFDYSLMMNNQESWYSARCSRRRGEGGEFAGVTAVVRNITDQKQAEAALKRARDE